MTDPASGISHSIERLVLASDRLPGQLDDAARFRSWRDCFASVFSHGLDLACAEDRPFQARVEIARLDGIGLVRMDGTLTRFACPPSSVDGDLILGINCGDAAMQWRQAGREAQCVPGALTVSDTSLAGEARLRDGLSMLSVQVPRWRLGELVADLDGLAARSFDPRLPAVRHLRRYLAILLEPGGIEDDPRLTDHVATTLVDLCALCLDAGRDAAEVAKSRGLRAARLQEVMVEIRAGFADPLFSAARVAARLGISTRYVQDLLQETGRSFMERVQELRLQKARAMLADPRHDVMRISEIAYACGFNEVSHFNRCFRRRFGASPTQYRGAKAGAG